MAGMFITFEGPEGSGKSTAIETLRSRLPGTVLVTREPGSGLVGAEIRRILLHGDELADRCELFLFLADRAQHIETIVKPALARGEIVLCDRHADSTVVYQGYGRGLELDRLRELNRFATGGLKPDLTLLFDIEPEFGLARVENKDRLDSESLDFHRKVREGFLAEMDLDPGRWVRVDAARSREEVAKDAEKAILDRMKL